MLPDFVYSREKTHASVTVTVIRDRKIRTALRTNQNHCSLGRICITKKIGHYSLSLLHDLMHFTRLFSLTTPMK